MNKQINLRGYYLMINDNPNTYIQEYGMDKEDLTLLKSVRRFRTWGERELYKEKLLKHAREMRVKHFRLYQFQIDYDY